MIEKTTTRKDFPVMGKITSFIFICVELLLLTSCRSVKLNATSTQAHAASVPTDASAAANLSEEQLPPAYVISPTQVLQSDKYSEGVVEDRQGNLYFSQTKAGTITVLAPDCSRPRIWATVPAANGHKIMPDDTHIVAAKNSARPRRTWLGHPPQ